MKYLVITTQHDKTKNKKGLTKLRIIRGILRLQKDPWHLKTNKTKRNLNQQLSNANKHKSKT